MATNRIKPKTGTEWMRWVESELRFLRLRRPGTGGGALMAMSAPLVEETWTEPVLGSSWVNVGAPDAVAGYRLHNGLVVCKGLVDGGIPGPLFVVPEGYRPAERHLFADVTVTADGTVTADVAGDAVSLAGVSWIAEA